MQWAGLCASWLSRGADIHSPEPGKQNFGTCCFLKGGLKCADLLTAGEYEVFVANDQAVSSVCSDETQQFGAFSLCFSVVYLVTHVSHTIHGNLCWDNSPQFLTSEVRIFNTIYTFEVLCTLLWQLCPENMQNVLKVGSSGFKCSTAVFVFCDKGLLYSVVILETSI